MLRTYVDLRVTRRPVTIVTRSRPTTVLGGRRLRGMFTHCDRRDTLRASFSWSRLFISKCSSFLLVQLNLRAFLIGLYNCSEHGLVVLVVLEAAIFFSGEVSSLTSPLSFIPHCSSRFVPLAYKTAVGARNYAEESKVEG